MGNNLLVGDFAVATFSPVEWSSLRGGKVSVVEIEHSKKPALFEAGEAKMNYHLDKKFL